MIKNIAKWILRHEINIEQDNNYIIHMLTIRIASLEKKFKDIQRCESKCDQNNRALEILQSKYVLLLNKYEELKFKYN